jgi:hypothetical protein
MNIIYMQNLENEKCFTIFLVFFIIFGYNNVTLAKFFLALVIQVLHLWPLRLLKGYKHGLS